jgi:hypothetical protein
MGKKNGYSARRGPGGTKTKSGKTRTSVRIGRNTGLSAIIADIRSVEGFCANEILQNFDVARKCETHSVCVPLKKNDGTNADLVIRYHPATIGHDKVQRTREFQESFFQTTLAGMPVGEDELRELCG